MPTPAASNDLPSTCQIRAWVVFGPGMHKDELYTPQRNAQIVRNFAKYSADTGHTVPRVALGHDQQQRFAKSLGFGNVGTITRCALVPGYEDQGIFEIDVANVPTEVGGEIEAGRLPGGSVELKSHQRDPADPSKEIPGDLLTGIAVLGEEQPAVRNFPAELQERSRPRATFADGRPVPPNASPTRWLNAMADVTRAMALEYRGEYDHGRRALRINGREFSDRVACFSDFNPNPGRTMTPEQEATLAAAGFTPEQIAAMKAAVGAPPAAPPTNPTMSDDKSKTGILGFADQCKKFADDPNATPEQKMMAAMFSELEENKKRVGELQASADIQQKKTEEAQMAAFSDQVEKALEPVRRKVAPAVIEKVHKPTLMGILTAKTFSAENERLKTFNDYTANLAALPDDPRLAAIPGAPDSKPAVLSGTGMKVLGAIRDLNPRVYAQHAGAN